MKEILKPIVLFDNHNSLTKNILPPMPYKITFTEASNRLHIVASMDYWDELDYYFARIGLRWYYLADEDRNLYKVNRENGHKTKVGRLKTLTDNTWEIV